MENKRKTMINNEYILVKEEIKYLENKVDKLESNNTQLVIQINTLTYQNNHLVTEISSLKNMISKFLEKNEQQNDEIEKKVDDISEFMLQSKAYGKAFAIGFSAIAFVLSLVKIVWEIIIKK